MSDFPKQDSIDDKYTDNAHLGDKFCRVEIFVRVREKDREAGQNNDCQTNPNDAGKETKSFVLRRIYFFVDYVT